MEEIRDDILVKSTTAKPSTKGAWALYVRRRWQKNAVKAVQCEWDLTEAQARGVVFAQASQATIDQILDHPRGGFGLGLKILEIKAQLRLAEWVQSERGRLENEAQRSAAEAAALAQMASRLPAALGLDDPGFAVVAAEPRSFRRRAGRGACA